MPFGSSVRITIYEKCYALTRSSDGKIGKYGVAKGACVQHCRSDRTVIVSHTFPNFLYACMLTRAPQLFATLSAEES